MKLKIESTDIILELGPGNGISLIEINEKIKPKRLIAVEISERFFIDILKLNIDKVFYILYILLLLLLYYYYILLYIIIQLELYSQDAIVMSYLKDNSVDKVIAINVAYFLNPFSNYCNEIYR
jgi:hypothetical protein